MANCGLGRSLRFPQSAVELAVVWQVPGVSVCREFYARACPAGGNHDHTGSGNYRLAMNLVSATGQPNWTWCRKCQGLAFDWHVLDPERPIERCPAGGVHDHMGSPFYTLVYNTPKAPGQSNWQWCNKCQGLCFAGNSTLGLCPAGAITLMREVRAIPC
jgi:hypothetical protein